MCIYHIIFSLLHLDGSLLCTSSTPSSDADYNDTTTSSSSSTSTSPSSPSNTVSPKIIGALLANIWKQYEHLWRDQEFKEMIVDCEVRRMDVSLIVL